MSKSCWDCLFGSRRGTNSEDTYHIQSQEITYRAPPWPKPQFKNGNMFILPKILDEDDIIIVTGRTSDQRERLTISLVTGIETPDYSNVACQLVLIFGDQVKTILQIINNGRTEPVKGDKAATISFARSDDPLSFDVKFKVRSTKILDIYAGPHQDSQIIETIVLKHDLKDIRFLAVHGDVQKITKLDFNFGKSV